MSEGVRSHNKSSGKHLGFLRVAASSNNRINSDWKFRCTPLSAGYAQARRPGELHRPDEGKIDSDLGIQMIARRFATVEPAFGNLTHNKRLDRSTLGGRRKVDGQWKLYCLTHNIEKLARRWVCELKEGDERFANNPNLLAS
jgi:Transposase DDE domain